MNVDDDACIGAPRADAQLHFAVTVTVRYGVGVRRMTMRALRWRDCVGRYWSVRYEGISDGYVREYPLYNDTALLMEHDNANDGG